MTVDTFRTRAYWQFAMRLTLSDFYRFMVASIITLLLWVPVSPVHAKDCSSPITFQGGYLETPGKSKRNWSKNFVDYSKFYSVAREVVGDFFDDEKLFDDFHEICVYTHRGLIDGAWGWASYESDRTTRRIVRRDIHVDVTSGSPIWTLLHEIGHHIAMPFVRNFPSEYRERHAEFWAGAISQRLESKWGSGPWSIQRRLQFSKGEWLDYAAKAGWAQAEWSDTILLKYGKYDWDWMIGPIVQESIVGYTSTGNLIIVDH